MFQGTTLFIAFSAVAFAQAEAFYQNDFPPAEFKARWQKVFDQIGSEAVAVMQGTPLTNGFSMPRQTNEFYYLCGIETPHSYLLLDGRNKKVTLYLPPRNPRLERSEGKVLSAEDSPQVKQLTGVDEVLSTDAIRGDWFGQLTGGAPRTVYTLLTPAEGNSQSRFELQNANASIATDYWDGRLPREAVFGNLIKARYPRATVLDITPILDEMRSVKSDREIALVKRASEIAGMAILEAAKSTKPGVYEYQLDAAARYIYLVNGARLEGYRSIAASGTQNIWNAHYYRNSRRMDGGDMVLFDYAPEFRYYTSDIARMWPVNGKFTPVQRELLQFVLEYRNAVMKLLKPGVTPKEILAEARAAMAPVFARTKFSKPVYEQAARKLLETGGGVLSHPVGMTVHDDGPYGPGALKPGHVFSIDPQLWVPEENLYVRYEDVVVIRPTGYENFTAFLPTELDDLEKLVRQAGGVVDKVPAKP